MTARPLHIGVDARELLGRSTGVGRYLSEVLLAWTGDPAWPHRLTLFAPAPVAEPERFGPRVEWVVSPARRHGTWWEQTRLPALVRRAGCDVLFAPAYTAPLRVSCPVVVLVHDVSFFAHPGWFGPREGWRRRWLTRAAARRAAVVLTVSEFSASEIVRWIGVPRTRVMLAPPAAKRPPARLERTTEEPIVLFVGSLFNRRLIPALIAGFAGVLRTIPGAQLVLVGDNRTRPVVDPRRVASDLGIAASVTWHDYVPDAALERLYHSARAFAFLSEYEGFGIPPLEGLAHGIPPLLLDTPVSREVYDSAAQFTTAEPEAIAAGLVTLLVDDDARRRILAAGEALLERYTWSRTAAAVAGAIERAVR